MDLLVAWMNQMWSSFVRADFAVFLVQSSKPTWYSPFASTVETARMQNASFRKFQYEFVVADIYIDQKYRNCGWRPCDHLSLDAVPLYKRVTADVWGALFTSPRKKATREISAGVLDININKSLREALKKVSTPYLSLRRKHTTAYKQRTRERLLP